MDQSRQADLKRIDDRIAGRRVRTRLAQDPQSGEVYKESSVETATHHEWVKEQAGRARAKIIAQSKDKKLSSLRRQLIRATQANDPAAAKIITARIKKHEKEEFEDYE